MLIGETAFPNHYDSGNPMETPQKNNPLHGITLERILTELVEHFGWEELGYQISINCFNHEPSIKSSLKFLRKTPWARTKVEGLYLWHKRSEERKEQKRARFSPHPEKKPDGLTEADDQHKNSQVELGDLSPEEPAHGPPQNGERNHEGQ
jgi:uncharacterized protein (DUF2132 family)